jgi:hypothetical protein
MGAVRLAVTGQSPVRAPSAAQEKMRRAGGLVVLGIDPGPHTGFLLAGWRPGEVRAALAAMAWQCSAAEAPGLLATICTQYGPLIAAAGLELFRSGPRAQKLQGTRADITRAGVVTLAALCAEHGIPVAQRPAADVMNWASDERLEAAGLLAVTAGKQHARAAGRHGLSCAVRHCGLPDPLSRNRSVTP